MGLKRAALLLLLITGVGWTTTRKATAAEMQAVMAAGGTDGKVARDIAGLKLGEWLSANALAELLRKAPGPDLETLRLMMARAVGYTATFIRTLPYFICTRSTRRFDDSPLPPTKWAERWKKMQLRDTLTEQATFSHGRELSNLQILNGRPYRGTQAMSGLVVSGEFGNVPGEMLLGKRGLKSWVSHWEIIDGRRFAVFSYYVDREHSHYTVSYCCHPIKDTMGRTVPSTLLAAFTGEIALDPATGTIYRVTWRTLRLPREYPTKQSSTFVEYRPVDIGGTTYICPVKSGTVPRSAMYETVGTDRVPLESINESRFTNYPKFGAEATFLATKGSQKEMGSKAPAPMEVLTAEGVARPSWAFDPETKEDANAEDESAAPTLNTQAERAASAALFPLPAPPPFVPRIQNAAGGNGPAVFREHLTVVTVPVVVRQADGRTVGDLKKEEFAVFDNGKRVPISQFAVERGAPSGQSGSKGSQGNSAPPDRYVSYVFDDLRLSAGDLQQARRSAKQVLTKITDAGTRVAVFATSGLVATPFTSDPATLERAWNKITPRAHREMCPDISPYVADRIINKNDGMALAQGISEMQDCQPMATGGGSMGSSTQSNPLLVDSTFGMRVKAEARHVLEENEFANRRELALLESVAQRMAVLPGQRDIVLISPGFILSDIGTAANALVDKAARSGVVVNAVDARGVYGSAGYKAEERGLSDPAMQRTKMANDDQEQKLQSNIMARLAYGTGGTLFENSNDLRAEIGRAAARPDVRYVLGIAPEESADGSFHRLKVKVAGHADLRIQARRGYVAPKHFDKPAEQAKYDMVQAVFSNGTRSDLPVTVQPMATESAINVTAHVDIHSIAFQKRAGVNHNVLTAAVILFDGDGQYRKGLQDQFVLDFPDNILAERMASGVSFKNEFKDVPPGNYWVRVVLRDAQGLMGTAEQAATVRQE